MNPQNKEYIFIPVFALIVLVVVTLACGDTAPADEPQVSTATPATAEEITETTQEPASEEPEPTEPPPTATTEVVPTYLGDAVEQYGYLISATSVEDPATPGMFYEAVPGKKLVAVEIIVGNVSGDPLSTNPLDATLVDTEGFTYQPELGGRDGQLDLADLNPGEKIRGWIAFSIPEEATVGRIKYAVEMFGDEVLQVGLEPPPQDHSAVVEPLSILPPPTETKLGDMVENYGYSLSASTVEDPAPPGMLYEPTVGHKLVAVEIVVGNVQGETLSVNPLDTNLVDMNGYVYTAELGGRDGQLELVDLAPGEKVRGWVAFTIPEEVSPASIKYSIDPFSDNFLQTGLHQ